MSLPIPSWAQGPIESFRASQTLPGATRKEIPADQVATVDRSIRTNVDEVISADETDLDQCKGQPNKLVMFGGAMKAEWTGNTTSGTFVETITDDENENRGAFVYAEFTPSHCSMLLLSQENGQVTGTARHADLARPERSFELVESEGFEIAR